MAQGLQKPDLSVFDAQLSKLQVVVDENTKNALLAEQVKKQIEAEIDQASADMSAGVLGAEEASKDAKARFDDKLTQINAFLDRAREAKSKISDLETEREKAAKTGATWIVGPGDSLSKIAKEVYGDAHAYMKIFEANKDKIKNPNLIIDGWELKIPEA
ncbi:MAG TPA: LysM peptidoglycan-binding domain-containing protein [Thermoflexales bacterium]|nr:LysM peptidoglycan-binding domain-containing protein [Thermoflexales bacterium]HQW35429.1 LysM peptidoglycan-binding domain-containing protein [Thermoflexales bacterium]HQZ22318.1 LysM peptidoglycan-binding domain-containing protein [Thermoflexales bacterium]HRA00608.1 LysM peptidoglycan-binding domain-containing protein [Thermoflexales bacterium]